MSTGAIRIPTTNCVPSTRCWRWCCEHILEQVDGEHAHAPSVRLDDAAWVGWRLVELLPLSDRQRQALLQEDDPHARLDQILALVS